MGARNFCLLCSGSSFRCCSRKGTSCPERADSDVTDWYSLNGCATGFCEATSNCAMARFLVASVSTWCSGKGEVFSPGFLEVTKGDGSATGAIFPAASSETSSMGANGSASPKAVSSTVSRAPGSVSPDLFSGSNIEATIGWTVGVSPSDRCASLVKKSVIKSPFPGKIAAARHSLPEYRFHAIHRSWLTFALRA